MSAEKEVAKGSRYTFHLGINANRQPVFFWESAESVGTDLSNGPPIDISCAKSWVKDKKLSNDLFKNRFSKPYPDDPDADPIYMARGRNGKWSMRLPFAESSVCKDNNPECGERVGHYDDSNNPSKTSSAVTTTRTVRGRSEL
jgi:hypothetical protein